MTECNEWKIRLDLCQYRENKRIPDPGRKQIHKARGNEYYSSSACGTEYFYWSWYDPKAAWRDGFC